MNTRQMLQKLVYKSASFVKHNSSTILTCIGAVGVATTAITAVQATPKALKLLEKAKEDKGEDLTMVETIVIAGPAYIPSAVAGVSTIACIFGANVLNKRQQATLLSAYALADRSYKDYRAKVREMLGEETDIKIRDAIIKDKCEYQGVYAPGCGSVDDVHDTQLFYDEWGERYFESTPFAVQNAEYHFNRNLTLRGYAQMNELYEFLGLEPTRDGGIFGYSVFQMCDQYGSNWVDFDHRMVTITDDGLECCAISLPIEPTIEFEDY